MSEVLRRISYGVKFYDIDSRGTTAVMQRPPTEEAILPSRLVDTFHIPNRHMRHIAPYLYHAKRMKHISWEDKRILITNSLLNQASRSTNGTFNPLTAVETVAQMLGISAEEAQIHKDALDFDESARLPGALKELAGRVHGPKQPFGYRVLLLRYQEVNGKGLSNADIGQRLGVNEAKVKKSASALVQEGILISRRSNGQELVVFDAQAQPLRDEGYTGAAVAEIIGTSISRVWHSGKRAAAAKIYMDPDFAREKGRRGVSRKTMESDKKIAQLFDEGLPYREIADQIPGMSVDGVNRSLRRQGKFRKGQYKARKGGEKIILSDAEIQKRAFTRKVNLIIDKFQGPPLAKIYEEGSRKLPSPRNSPLWKYLEALYAYWLSKKERQNLLSANEVPDETVLISREELNKIYDEFNHEFFEKIAEDIEFVKSIVLG